MMFLQRSEKADPWHFLLLVADVSSALEDMLGQSCDFMVQETFFFFTLQFPVCKKGTFLLKLTL